MRLDYPGIGGSLGQCVLCGDSFASEVLFGKNIATVHIDGFETPAGLPLHQKCLTKMEGLRGQGWETLPDGPLRSEYAQAMSEIESRAKEQA